MDNYVCEIICNDDRRIVTVRAENKRQAKSIIRALKMGYTIRLKDINPMYIDNSRKPINKR